MARKIKHIGKLWAAILSLRPDESLAKQCPWEKFTGEDWCKLLKKQPHFSSLCNWELFDGWDWARLLAQQPQFAEFCHGIKYTAITGHYCCNPKYNSQNIATGGGWNYGI